MSISLVVLLWACGALGSLSCMAITEGLVTGMSVLVALIWPVSFSLGLVVTYRDRLNMALWRRRE